MEILEIRIIRRAELEELGIARIKKIEELKIE